MALILTFLAFRLRGSPASFHNSFGSSSRRSSRIYIQGVRSWYPDQLLTLRFLQKPHFEPEDLEFRTRGPTRARPEERGRDEEASPEYRQASAILLPVSALNRVRFI